MCPYWFMFIWTFHVRSDWALRIGACTCVVWNELCGIYFFRSSFCGPREARERMGHAFALYKYQGPGANHASTAHNLTSQYTHRHTNSLSVLATMASSAQVKMVAVGMMLAIMFMAVANASEGPGKKDYFNKIDQTPDVTDCICSKSCACAGKCILDGGDSAEDIRKCFVDCVLKNDCKCKDGSGSSN